MNMNKNARMETYARISTRRGKEKVVSSFFRQAKCTAHFGCTAASKRLKF